MKIDHHLSSYLLHAICITLAFRDPSQDQSFTVQCIVQTHNQSQTMPPKAYNLIMNLQTSKQLRPYGHVKQ